MKERTSKYPRVLSFSSGKGGVGKTSVVTNTALAISRLGQRVMIVDADLGLANIDIMLGLAAKHTIKHVFSGEKSISEVLIEGPEGVIILPAASGVPELINLSNSEKLFLLNEIKELSAAFDILLIDTSAGISDNVIYFNMVAQQRIIIVTPEPTSITDAYALIKVLANRHLVRNFSILVNQTKDGQEAQNVYRQLSAITGRFLGLMSMDYLGFIPKDDAIPKAVANQQTVLEIFPGCEASKGFMDLAQYILDDRSKNHVDGNVKYLRGHLLRT
jgi:flagellar biosynthesis protein FlhG